MSHSLRHCISQSQISSDEAKFQFVLPGLFLEKEIQSLIASSTYLLSLMVYTVKF